MYTHTRDKFISSKYLKVNSLSKGVEIIDNTIYARYLHYSDKTAISVVPD